MSKRGWSRAALSAALVLALVACNDSNRGRAFKLNEPPVQVGSMRVHVASSVDQPRRALAYMSANEHWNNAFLTGVVPVVQTTHFGAPYPAATRDVWVYDVPFIKSPTQLGSQGYVRFGDKSIHLVIGGCNELPKLTELLTESYYFPNGGGMYTGNASISQIWSAAVIPSQNRANVANRFRNGCP